ncbi:hypothetical protein J2Y69_003066 [Microbacterium resistens]|uniref:Uncharacterized protein n=1 Tax=Microbacterium resistens TaxID=156977 RepID=A0ABU1SFS4_9MICO|nr:hypothetical protein [Microbacterium resistens]MDR6868450.1 hypothetical protein [Microbacterium resistens]
MNEQVQRGTAADGNGIVLWVPAIADPTRPTLAELTAPTVKRLTYGLARDGFTHETDIVKITSGRYTLAQALQYDGTVTDDVTVKWVYNRTTPTAIEATLGAPGVSGNIVHALGYPNRHTFAEGDKLNAVIPVETSIPKDVPATENTELMKEQRLNVVGEVAREVAIVAGP